MLSGRESFIRRRDDASGPHCEAEACGLKVITSTCQPARGSIAAPDDHRKPHVKKLLSARSSLRGQSKKAAFESRLISLCGHNTGINKNSTLNRHVCFDRLYLHFTVQTYETMAICILADCDQCTQLTPPRAQRCRRRLNWLAAYDVNPPRCTFNVMPLYYRHPGMDWRPMLICLISS